MDTIPGYTGVLNLRITLKEGWVVAATGSKLRLIQNNISPFGGIGRRA